MSRYSLGAAAITFGLSLLPCFFAFSCNDVAGCPIPSLLPARPFTRANVKADTGLLNLSITHFINWEMFVITVIYMFTASFSGKSTLPKKSTGPNLCTMGVRYCIASMVCIYEPRHILF